MNYVDGFVAAVPTANKAEYIKHARDAAVVFKEHGALKMVECWGDDIPVIARLLSRLQWSCFEDQR